MDSAILFVFQLLVLLFSVIVHEVSHGVAALRLGDSTAKRAGRLTLNPIKHLELFGSFLLPLSMFLMTQGAFVLGWAKPVPYNPNYLRDPKKGAGIIAAVGPLSNLLIAGIFSLFLRFFMPLAAGLNQETLVPLITYIIFMNILLAVFNLIPIPPLDGANLLFAFLPARFSEAQRFLQRYGFIFLIGFILFGFNFLIPIVNFIFRLFVGGPFGL